MIESVSSLMSHIPIKIPCFKKSTAPLGGVRVLSQANLNQEYIIKRVIADDESVSNFLFTLGCFAGESITLISVLSETYVIAIKDARYSLDLDLAKSIELA